MIFTGKNLKLVRYGIALAIDELHNQIATCPDVYEYADDLEALGEQMLAFKKLLARVNKAMEKENAPNN